MLFDTLFGSRGVGTISAIMLAIWSGSTAQSAGPSWTVRGEALVTCPCRVPCPCRSNAPPSQPHCENLSYVHVVQGNYGTVSLDRLKYLWAADECTGRHSALKPASLFFPTSATQAQVGAVERIMAGEFRVHRVPLEAAASGSLYSIRVPGAIAMDVDVAPGPIPMEPLPALDLWGNTVTYARNITARIDVNDLKWDYSGLQANYRTFEADAVFAARGLLLGLFRDDTGRFNEAQRALIRELHLEIPLGREDFDRMLAQTHAPSPQMAIRLADDAHGSVGGVVLDTEGKPRSGARVRLTPDGNAVQVAVTNPAGRYFIAHAPKGASRLCASTWDGRHAAENCVPLTMTPGAVLQRNLKLSATNPH